MLASFWCKTLTVDTPKETDNDRMNASAATKKKAVVTNLQRARSPFSQSLLASAGE